MNLGIIPVAEANIQGLMNSVSKVIIDPLIVLLFSLAVVYFIYGLAQYLLNPNNEDVRKTSKVHMLYGIIGIFIMVSVYGIIEFIINTIS